MKKNSVIIYIIISILLFSCGGSSLEEKEDNNTFQNAQKIKINSIITGNFKSASDIDTFKLDMRNTNVKNMLLKITLSGIRGISTRINVYNHKHLLILSADDFFVNQKEMLVNFKPEKKIYFIRLTIEKVKGRIKFPSKQYNLQISSFSEDNIEYEPNNDFSNAQDITSIKKIKGYFSPFFSTNFNYKIAKSVEEYLQKSGNKEVNLEKLKKHDIDIFKIRLPEQEKYNASIILSSTENVNVVLFLMNSSGRIIELRNNHGFGKGEGISNLTLNGGKTYYVVVCGYERTINFDPLKDTYTLEYKTHSFAHDQETEPNNDKPNATPIASSVTKGYLSPVSDHDWYKLTITPKLMRTIDKNYTGYLNNRNATSSGQRPDMIMTVKLKAIPDIDLMFEIADEHGQVLKTVNSEKAGKDEVMINFSVSFGKVYYIVVKGAPENTKESFKEQYKLIISFKEKMQNEEAEPNDTKTMNINPDNQVKVGGGINGYMSPAKDVDYIYVTINNPGKYEIKISSVPGIKFRMEMYDPEDFAIGVASSKKSGTGAKLTRIIDSTGIHYIVIKNISRKRSYNNKTRYFLSIKRIK